GPDPPVTKSRHATSPMTATNGSSFTIVDASCTPPAARIPFRLIHVSSQMAVTATIGGTAGDASSHGTSRVRYSTPPIVIAALADQMETMYPHPPRNAAPPPGARRRKP